MVGADLVLGVAVPLLAITVSFLGFWVVNLARAVKRLAGIVAARTGAPVDPPPRHLSVSDTGPAVSHDGGSANSGIVVNGPHIRRRYHR